MSSGAVVIAGRFEIDQRVGAGAFGEVWRGTDRTTGVPVAVKRLHAHVDDESARDRFDLEARLLREIDSPYVVHHVADGSDDEGRRYLALEWLDGMDLARRQRSQPATIAETVDILRQAAMGLRALHAHGIVHRDVKPSNFFVGGDGPALRVTLIDLGIARRIDVASALTMDGARIGTPAYMSPEQARADDDITERSDQFSLGVMAYELLTGKRPFRANDPFALLAKIMLEDPVPLRTLAPDVPADLEKVVHRALARDPLRRFNSARDLALALASLDLHAAADGVPATPENSEAVPTVVESSAVISTSEMRVVTAILAELRPRGSEVPAETSRLDFDSIVRSHGGASQRAIGGRAIAVFGLDRSHGDEPMRAARAALECVHRVPGCRLAIATCRVLRGASGLDGEPIERAAERLHGARDGVAIDDGTANAISGHFEIAGEEGSRVLRGARELDDRVAPKLLGRTTTTVGRRKELDMLLSTFSESADDSRARAVLVTGVAGMGKSRLRYEFLSRVTEGRPVTVLTGAGDPVGAGSPFGMLGGALRRHAGIREGEPIESKQARLRAAVASVVAPDACTRVTTFLAEIAGIPFSESDDPALRAARRDAVLMNDAMRMAWEDWLTAHTAVRPVLLVLEDLHWGDLPTVRFVEIALSHAAELPFMVLAIARPEVNQRFPALWKDRAVTQIVLDGLAKRACEMLASEVLGSQLSKPDLERLIDRSEGNPFHLEELLRAASAGVLDTLPDSLLGVAQARLDALDPEARRVLRLASVFGRRFWRGAVETIARLSPGTQTDVLDRLALQEVLIRRPTAVFPDETEYAFRHALLRDAAYEALPEIDRVRAHAIAGTWLQNAGESDAMVLAEHFDRGGEPIAAGEQYLRAAQQSLDASDLPSAIARAERAVHCGVGDEDAARARLIQAEANRWLGDSEAAEAAARDALNRFARGSRAWWIALGEAAISCGRQGNADGAEAFADLWETTAPGSTEAVSALISGARMSTQLLTLGRFERSRSIQRTIHRLAAAGATTDPLALARYEQLQAYDLQFRYDFWASLGHRERARELFRQCGETRNVCLETINIGNACTQLGALERGVELLREALATANRLGMGIPAGYAAVNLGHALAALGQFDEARDLEQRAVREGERAGERRLRGSALIRLALIAIETGDAELGEALSREAVDVVSVVPTIAPGAVAALCRSAVRLGRIDEALQLAHEADAGLRGIERVETWEWLVRLVRVEALDAAGFREDADTALREALDAVDKLAKTIADPAARGLFRTRAPEAAAIVALAGRLRQRAS